MSTGNQTQMLSHSAVFKQRCVEFIVDNAFCCYWLRDIHNRLHIYIVRTVNIVPFVAKVHIM